MYVEGGENVGEREGWPPVWCGETGGPKLAISQYTASRAAAILTIYQWDTN